MSKEPPIDLQSLWQSQPVETKRLSPEEIRNKATRFQRTVRFRNLREHAAAVFVVVVFSAYTWRASTWLAKAGPALIVVGALYVMFQLSTRASSRSVPGAATESCIHFHRRELERQRDMLRTIWRWYIGPLVPGLLVLFLDRFIVAWAKGGSAIASSLGSALFCVLVLVAVGRLNAAGAKRLQREIDALERL